MLVQQRDMRGDRAWAEEKARRKKGRVRQERERRPALDRRAAAPPPVFFFPAWGAKGPARFKLTRLALPPWQTTKR